MVIYDLVENVALAHPAELQITAILQRDIFFYGHMIQVVDEKENIDVENLLELCGTDKMDELQSALALMMPYMESRQFDRTKSAGYTSSFKFQQNYLNEINTVFYEQGIYYLNQKFDLLPNLTGRIFIDQMNKRSKSRPLTSILDFFSKLGLTESHISLNLNPAHKDIAKLINIPGSETPFLLSIISGSETIVGEKLADQLKFAFESAVNQVQSFIPYLIVVPSLGNGLRSLLENRASWYCMWDLTFVSFLRGIEYMIQQEPSRTQTIGQHFIDIFERDARNRYAGSIGSYHYTEMMALSSLAQRFDMDVTNVVKKNTHP